MGLVVDGLACLTLMSPHGVVGCVGEEWDAAGHVGPRHGHRHTHGHDAGRRTSGTPNPLFLLGPTHRGWGPW
jgi:hypothetical protein